MKRCYHESFDNYNYIYIYRETWWADTNRRRRPRCRESSFALLRYDVIDACARDGKTGSQDEGTKQLLWVLPSLLSVLGGPPYSACIQSSIYSRCNGTTGRARPIPKGRSRANIHPGLQTLIVPLAGEVSQVLQHLQHKLVRSRLHLRYAPSLYVVRSLMPLCGKAKEEYPTEVFPTSFNFRPYFLVVDQNLDF